MDNGSAFELLKETKENIEGYAVVATAVIAVLGYSWRTVVTNRDKARRLGQINRSFQDITKILTANASDKERLAAAILLRRFFDKDGEYSLRVMFHRGTPYAKAALELVTALLKIEPDGPVQKALADSLVLSDNLASIDMQQANLSNAYLGKRGTSARPSIARGIVLRGVHLYNAYLGKRGASDRSSLKGGIVLRGVDLYMANLSGASLRHADCENAVFSDAIMNGTVLDEANLKDANFKRTNLKGARFNNAILIDANFIGADLSNTNFTGADLTGADFSGVDLKTARFDGAKNPPVQVDKSSN